jgi:hypothetical protein
MRSSSAVRADLNSFLASSILSFPLAGLLMIASSKHGNIIHDFIAKGNYSSNGLNADANGKLKCAVVKFNITNRSPPVIDVPFAESDGSLPFYPGVDGNGPAMDLINQAFPKAAHDGETRVVVVKKMRSFYELKEAAAAGARAIRITAKNVTLGRPPCVFPPYRQRRALRRCPQKMF